MSQHIVSPVTYLFVFLALIALTLLTTAVAYAPLGPFADPVALAIACTKAALVVLFFMHAIHSDRLVIATLLVAVCWLAIMISLTMSDVLTRDWIPGGTLASYLGF